MMHKIIDKEGKIEKKIGPVRSWGIFYNGEQIGTFIGSKRPSAKNVEPIIDSFRNSNIDETK